MARRSDDRQAQPTRAKKRRRLPPEERRRQLMEVAASIVTSDGQAALTMERLAIKAGVSNGTVYLYFANRAEVLLALLEEHWTALDEESHASRAGAGSFEELTRQAVHIYLRAAPRRGPAFRRLNYEPSVEPAVEEKRLARRTGFLDRLAGQYRKQFGLSAPASRAAASMLLGALEAGAELVAAEGADPDIIEDLQVALVFGGLRRLAEDEPAAKARATER